MDDAAAYPLLDLPPAAHENGRFTVAIVAALALHLAALTISLYTPTTTRMGEETGSQEGLTVEIVDENDLSTPAGQPPATPATPPAPQQPTVTSPSQPSPAQPVPAELSPAAEPTPDLKPTAHEEAPPPVQEAPAAMPEAAKPPPAPASALDELDPNLFKIQPQTEAKTNAAPAAQPKPQQPQAKLPKATKAEKPEKPEKPTQLSMTVPTPSFTSSNDSSSGRSAGISRPAGITRSGLNDEFGRGVIRALRQTMPPNSRAARATVRFVLTKDGNLAEVELVQSSGDATLDQNVVFAVKQANFPIPATNLTALDRQFRVTYVYR